MSMLPPDLEHLVRLFFCPSREVPTIPCGTAVSRKQHTAETCVLRDNIHERLVDAKSTEKTGSRNTLARLSYLHGLFRAPAFQRRYSRVSIVSSMSLSSSRLVSTNFNFTYAVRCLCHRPYFQANLHSNRQRWTLYSKALFMIKVKHHFLGSRLEYVDVLLTLIQRSQLGPLDLPHRLH